ncbi:MAG: hypothetical protein ACOC3D_03960 [Pseudomonadota bacterium]
MRRLACLAVLLLSLLSPPVLADEVLDSLERARDLYRGGEFGGAITELEYAIQALREASAERFARTFPEPPDGWSAGAVEPREGLPAIGGLTLGRVYEGPGTARMEARLAIDDPMSQAVATLLQNPALLALQPNAERVRVHWTNALLIWPGDGTGELSLLLNGRAYMKVTGEGLADRRQLIELLAAWDVDEVRRVAGF